MLSRLFFLVIIIVSLNLLRDLYTDDVAQRRPLPRDQGQLPDHGKFGQRLEDSTDSVPEIRVGLGQKTDSTGTAFAVDDRGWWITARHVADQCRQIKLLFPGRRGMRVNRVVQHPNADLALLHTGSVHTTLRLSTEPLYVGQNGYHVGYPQGRPGEVWSTLLGRRRMRISGRYRTNEPIVAWAERRRHPGNLPSLGGLSGGPTLDDAGRVVGALIAESNRRGRVYTTAPASVRQLVPEHQSLRARGNNVDLSPSQLLPKSEKLRREARIAKVICLIQ